MAKDPKKSSIKRFCKKGAQQDKSRRQKTNKRPLRNSANVNKLYSGGGGVRIAPISSDISPPHISTLDERLKVIFQTILNEKTEDDINKFINELDEPLKKICDKLYGIEGGSIHRNFVAFIKDLYKDQNYKDLRIAKLIYETFEKELTEELTEELTDEKKKKIEESIKLLNFYILNIEQHLLHREVIEKVKGTPKTQLAFFLDRLNEVNKYQDLNLESDFVYYLIRYLKTITYHCNKYIDNIFSERASYSGLTCYYYKKIDKIYNLVLKYRKEGSDINVFKKNLLRLLNDKPELTQGELGEHYNKVAIEKKQQEAQEADAAKRKERRDREEKEELKVKKRYEKEKRKKEVLLTSIQNDLNCLTDSDILTLTKGKEKDLSNITKIYLVDSSSRISSLASYLVNIDTIILENFDLEDIKEFFKNLDNLDNLDKIKTLVLKHDEFSNSSDILELLNIINKMTKLTNFEFSNFQIDLKDLQNSGDENSIVTLFTSILKLGSFTKFNFYDNTFKNEEAESHFNSVLSILEDENKDDGTKLYYIVDWLFRFQNINPLSYRNIYLKWLDSKIKIEDRTPKNIRLQDLIKEQELVRIDINYYDVLFNELTLEWNLHNKKINHHSINPSDRKRYLEWLNSKIADEQQINDPKKVKNKALFKEFISEWNSLNNEKIRDWFKSLIKIKINLPIDTAKPSKVKHQYDGNYDYDTLLFIIIKYYTLYDTGELLGDTYDEDKKNDEQIFEDILSKIRDTLIELCGENNIKSIFNLFILKKNDFRPTSTNISNKYKDVLSNIATDITSIETLSIKDIDEFLKISSIGGRKIKTKVAPKKEPKKTPKKAKVVLKEPNTYAVIKQKIRIKTVK